MHLEPRHLHPAAWWLWAIGLGVAATRTTNPILLAILALSAAYVVVLRRTTAPWARAFAIFIRIGVVLVIVRIILVALVGPEVPGREIVRLPEATLPDWMAGVRLGGPITVEAVVGATYTGLQLLVLLGCVGAANALAHPARLLKALPGALYEAGVAVVVALSFAPQAVSSVGRIRAARRLRGRPDRGIAGLRGLAIPVLEDAVSRSVQLAASMDSRGYGRQAPLSATVRHLTAGLSLAGMLAVCVGAFGLLDANAGAYGVPTLLAGVVAIGAGLALGGRRSVRTRYRPDPWWTPEWCVALSGFACATVFLASSDGAALHPGTAPLVAPPAPWLLLVGAAVAVLPALAAPPAPSYVQQVAT